MGITHLKDGQDFSPEHFSKDFGFRGSAEHAPPHRARGGKMHQGGSSALDEGSTGAPSFERGSGSDTDSFRHGGAIEHPDGRVTHHHADGGHHVVHPDGRVEHHHAHGGHTVIHPDGRTIQHHAHGGHTVHHPDGRRDEHHPDGHVIQVLLDGTREHHDSSELAHRARGGHMEHRARGGAMDDVSQDRSMVAKGVHQHEEHLHRGQPETDLHLARGGNVRRPRMPQPSGMAEPVNRAPRPPMQTRTPPNTMSGGVIPYGVQPSDESGEMDGSTPPAMARGGRHRR